MPLLHTFSPILSYILEKNHMIHNVLKKNEFFLKKPKLVLLSQSK